MAEEFDFNAWIAQRAKAHQDEQQRDAARQDMNYLAALQRESRRRTGKELSPELAAALILRRTVLKSNLG
jgi:hypothetical protein